MPKAGAADTARRALIRDAINHDLLRPDSPTDATSRTRQSDAHTPPATDGWRAKRSKDATSLKTPRSTSQIIR